MGDPRLLRVARPVTQFDTSVLDALIEDLFDTMRAAGGVGLAAPQVGVDLAVVLFGFDRSLRYPDAPSVPRTILVNPRIVPLGEAMADDWEGCLSVPGLRGKVPRYTHIRYEGQDRSGAPVVREARDFHARVVQHECDHLIGKLYPMRMNDFTGFGFTDVLFPGLDAPSDE